MVTPAAATEAAEDTTIVLYRFCKDITIELAGISSDYFY